ncbi:hypothetical protein K502DRAFT_324443 [Neoconidiobolus thromboides FSU 785]|nr:hypothetical protein K502DRAFT_324443 [Neoconidiobolus thromboides FSU 785]
MDQLDDFGTNSMGIENNKLYKKEDLNQEMTGIIDIEKENEGQVEQEIIESDSQKSIDKSNLIPETDGTNKFKEGVSKVERSLDLMDCEQEIQVDEISTNEVQNDDCFKECELLETNTSQLESNGEELKIQSKIFNHNDLDMLNDLKLKEVAVQVNSAKEKDVLDHMYKKQIVQRENNATDHNNFNSLDDSKFEQVSIRTNSFEEKEILDDTYGNQIKNKKLDFSDNKILNNDKFEDFNSFDENETFTNFEDLSETSHIQNNSINSEFFTDIKTEGLSLPIDVVNFGEEDKVFQISTEEIVKQEFGSLLCYDLWQSLTLEEDIGDVRLNNKNRLKWKQSNMRRHCMMALGVPFDIDEALPKQVPSIDKMAANGYKKQDMEIIANRLDTTLSLSLCNIPQDSLNKYSHSDLYQLSKLIDQTLEEVSLSIEYWRSKVRESEESEVMYDQMIANLVSHTHKSKQSNFSNSTLPITKN